MLHSALKKLYVFILVFVLSSGQLMSTKLSKCPGSYCGRVAQTGSSNLSACGACPRGFRTDGYTCIKCNSSLLLYDWLYLGFMVFIIPIINCHFISCFEPKRRFIGFLRVTTIIESLVSIFISLLVIEPYGQLTLKSCNKESIKDWYTVFFNPKPDYVHVIRCTQEAVYPLFTIVLVYYACCLLMSVILRPLFTYFLKGSLGRSSLYASMYLLPIITVVHAAFSGLIYYAFPYLILVASSIGSAIYLSLKSDQLWSLWKNVDSVLVLVTYCLTNAYGIISVTLLHQPVRDGKLLLLIALPILFYFVTFRLTDPSKFS